MAQGGVKVGICKVQIDPVCGNTPRTDLTPFLACNIDNIDYNTRVEEVAPLQVDGGTPGTDCFYLDLPNKELNPEVVFSTCTGTSPLLDNATGRAQAIQVPTDPADPTALGWALKYCPGEESRCFCTCSETGEACENMLAITVWRRYYCYGSTGQVHPDGKFWIDHYPGLKYTVTAQTESSTNGTDDGNSYVFIANINAGYAGPGDIVPAELIVGGDCYRYGWPSNICPPGECECGSCGEDTPPVYPESLAEPLAVAAKTTTTAVKAPTPASV